MISIYVPEEMVEWLVNLVFTLGGYSVPTDGCECVYLDMLFSVIKFVLEV